MEIRFGVAVKGIILHKKKVLLIRRAEDDPHSPGEWECAGGKLEFGEELEEAMKREALEETGLRVCVEELLYAVTFQNDPGRQVVLLTYLCRSEDGIVTLSAEHTAYQWLEPEAALTFLPEVLRKDWTDHHVPDKIKQQEMEEGMKK